MTTSSFWVEDLGLETRAPLTGDAECDLVVIGSGIAGLSSAYEAARFGWRVIVIERHETIGGVMTPRTTAHLASELDDFYHYLIKAVGEDDARTYYESQVAAINRIERTVDALRRRGRIRIGSRRRVAAAVRRKPEGFTETEAGVVRLVLT